MTPSRRHRPSLVRRAATVVVAGVLPLSLSACGASMDAMTYQERNSAGSANTSVGAMAVRNLAVQAPRNDRTYEQGTDATATLVLANSADEPDRLVEVTTDAAESVEVLVDGKPGELEVPARGSTADTAELRLVELKQDLREGENVSMTLRFERSGSLDVQVPIGTSDETDRPVYTGEEGGHEPALQAPAGGHHGEAEGEDTSEGEGEEGSAQGEGEENSGH